MNVRELKFRAWLEKENKMLAPEDLALSYDGEDCFDFAFDKTSVVDDEGGIKGTLLFELMQYTGLKDKNGKEIFEGDIVQGRNRAHDLSLIKQRVTFLNGCFMLGNWNSHEYFNKHQEIEVIGNIYEDKHLLNS